MTVTGNLKLKLMTLPELDAPGLTVEITGILESGLQLSDSFRELSGTRNASGGLMVLEGASIESLQFGGNVESPLGIQNSSVGEIVVAGNLNAPPGRGASQAPHPP